MEKLGPLLEETGHILLMETANRDDRFYLWWVPWVENNVDFEKSEKYSDGLGIAKYAYNFDKLIGLDAFRTHYDGMYKPEAQSDIHVTDRFKKAWEDAGLTGIDFKPW